MGDRHYRFESHIVSQMRYLVSKGVLPSWENFRQFGGLWPEVKKHLSKSEQARYRWTWLKVHKDTMPAPTP